MGPKLTGQVGKLVDRPHHASARDGFIKYRLALIKGWIMPAADTVVWIQGPDRKNFSATLPVALLGDDYVNDGPHKGLVWWPFDEAKWK